MGKETTTRKPKEELLSELRELLDYGISQSKKASIRTRGEKPKKIVTLFLMGAAQSASEGLFTLISQKQVVIAESVFRTLLEVFLKLNFVLLDKTYRNAVSFIADSQHSQMKMANANLGYIKKYPNLPSVQDTNFWRNAINEAQKNLKGLRRNYRQHSVVIMRRDPILNNLEQMALVCDQVRNKRVKKPNGLFEQIYCVAYRFACGYTHFDSFGVQRLSEQDSTGNFFLNVSGKEDEIPRLIKTTYIFYFEILRMYLRVFDIYDKKEIASFRKIADYKNKLP